MNGNTLSGSIGRSLAHSLNHLRVLGHRTTPYTTPKKIKHATIQSGKLHNWLTFWRKSFDSLTLVSINTKAQIDVFKLLRFEECFTLVWTEGFTVEVKLRF